MFKKLKIFFHKSSNLQSPQKEKIATSTIENKLSNIETAVRANNLDKVVKELEEARFDLRSNKDLAIISIFIIPACYFCYLLSIDGINEVYWHLVSRASLGFKDNPIINSFIKLLLTIPFVLFALLIFLNLKPEKENKKRAFFIDILCLIPSCGVFFGMTMTIENIDENKFLDGYNLLSLLICNKYFVISSVIAVVIMLLFYFINKAINKKKNLNFDRVSNFFFLLGVIWFFTVDVGAGYIIYHYLKMHQSFSSECYKESANYIHLKDKKESNIYLIQCDSKCFGYEIIHKDNNPKLYDSLPIIFKPEDIIFPKR